MKVQEVARVCHEVNRSLQIFQNDYRIPISNDWDNTDAETQASALQGVLAVLEGQGPAELHQSWLNFKISHGWTLGPTKDEDLKEHPSLVPYEDLPESQRLKDHVFYAIVHAMTERGVT